MCGIIGYVGEREAAPILLEGLARLEYRGYDSVGIAILKDGGGVAIHKQVGKLGGLASTLSEGAPAGHQGIGHTRWATHGKPSDINAHPHTDCTGDIVVIHNGIVENYEELKQRLVGANHKFASETDTEVIPHLLEEHLRTGKPLHEALEQTLAEISGAHAILAMSRAEPGTIVAARAGNAGGIVVGYGHGESYLASDLPALLPHTRRVVFMEDGDVARVTPTKVTYRHGGATVERSPQQVPYDPVSAAKGSFKHFMQKEIAEQPEAILDTLRGRALFSESRVELEDLRLTTAQFREIKRVVLVGMGTSLNAAMIGRHYIERIGGIPAEADNASELRYREPIIGPDTLIVSVSQSGETVDTLAAMEEAREKGCPQVTISNVVGSQATRVADGVIYTRCGPEIGVASTKTYVAAICALYLLACYIGQERGAIDRERMGGLLAPLARLPYLAGEVANRGTEYERLAHEFFRCENFLYLGRGLQYPVAMEGALKLKEVSYIHAEGYPAGEMKHGPIALIDREMPVVALVQQDRLRDKMMSNVEQVKAREGIVVAVATEGDTEVGEKADHVIYVPRIEELLAPVLTSIPLQLFAYNVAVRRGCDVDQPRNLAKTVTVE
ncbi:MAG TPA: glutamine--fructose-6-phosphate transaminase (isomerizing) [Dehalococcoidia bacterium]|jgi:glucosamine--fructose-6-phosphate aminotransferase (isomerizing)|nr:glutamine--fructose-6-phosphate transaminase (isomerizing) [Dehalococcoidia bacterium]